MLWDICGINIFTYKFEINCDTRLKKYHMLTRHDIRKWFCLFAWKITSLWSGLASIWEDTSKKQKVVVRGERALDGASHLPRTATGFTIRTVTPDLRSKPSHRIYGQNRHTSLCCSEPKMSDPVDELSSPPSQHLCPPRLGMTGHRHIARRGMSGAARRWTRISRSMYSVRY